MKIFIEFACVATFFLIPEILQNLKNLPFLYRGVFIAYRKYHWSSTINCLHPVLDIGLHINYHDHNFYPLHLGLTQSF